MTHSPTSLPAARALSVALLIALFLVTGIPAQQPAQSKEKQKSETRQPAAPPAGQATPGTQDKKVPLFARSRITLGDLNISVTTDKRVIVTMAALNLAGFDYEPGNRQLSALRQQLREDLKNTSPELVRKLRDYFLSHKKGQTDAASVAPYLSLALSLNDPPSFSLDTPPERLPEDVREITDFALLLEEFYSATGFTRLLPKYVAAYQNAMNQYAPVTAKVAGMVLSYLRTEPILELPPLFMPRAEPQKEEKKQKSKDPAVQAAVQESFKAPMRERRFVIVPDLLNSTGAANLRVIRDTYYLLVGPTSTPNEEAVRLGFLKFVIDPLTERQVKEVRAIGEDLKKLRDTRGENVAEEFRGKESSAYYLITDSLVRAANERIALLEKIYSGQYADEKALRQAVAAAEEEAIYRLSLSYERGSVLVYHFYDLMKAYEDVGINIRDYFTSLIDPTLISFEREARRLEENKTKIENYKKHQAELAARPVLPATISNADPQIAARLNEADEMIKARRYDDARAILESVRRERPANARALFGLAEVTSKKAQEITDKDRLGEELYAAVELYKMASQNASQETEKWLAQRSYVAAGKILEFLNDFSDAAAAYDLAIRLGEVTNGAYKDAVAGKQRVEQKIKQ
jgi:tetratricopeptide (TPR) repeat protein